jgi:anti-sigma regulatory factor (Ser/Thr protein kinase)
LPHSANNSPGSLEHQIELVIQSRLDAVPLLVNLVGSLCELAGASPVERHLVVLCLAEAANNSIIHAYHGEPGNKVKVEVTLHPERLVFEVIDTGAAADVVKMNADRRHAIGADSLGALAENGRGLAIMQEVMDLVEYSTEAGCNRLRLTKRVERKKS